MNQIIKDGKNYTGYEYKEIIVDTEFVSHYIDGYVNFGWEVDSNVKQSNPNSRSIICLKRNRKILNKTELTRLEQHFEACMDEIIKLKKSEINKASIVAIFIGIIGTVFITCATFAVVNKPPLIFLCIIFSIPGFLGWISPYFIYIKLRSMLKNKIVPLLEKKYDEIHEICEKGNHLL